MVQPQAKLLQQLPEMQHADVDHHCRLLELCSDGLENQTPWTCPLAPPCLLAWALPGALQHLQAQHALRFRPDD